MKSKRALVVLDQSAFDPTSGAARAMRSSAEVLASTGWSVRFLSSTATEGPLSDEHFGMLRAMGLAPQVREVDVEGMNVRLIDASWRGVGHTLVDHGPVVLGMEAPGAGMVLEGLLEQELEHFEPSLVYTFGGSPTHMMMRFRARRRGVPVVVALHNLAHRNPAAFADADAVSACSPFVSAYYKGALGLRSEVLPFPLREEDVVVRTHEAIDVTFVNPSAEKGAMLAGTLFGMLMRDRPDIPIRVVVGRTPPDLLLRAASDAGFDLSQHSRLTIEGPLPAPADVLRRSRVVIVPSVWVEPGGMIAAEAVLNGIPVISSERGGTPGTAAGGGRVIDLPPRMDARTRVPATQAEARPWFDEVVKHFDDDVYYEARSVAARQAGVAFGAEAVRSAHERFFAGVSLRAGGVHPQGAGMRHPVRTARDAANTSMLIVSEGSLFDRDDATAGFARAIGETLLRAGWDVRGVGRGDNEFGRIGIAYTPIRAEDYQAYESTLAGIQREQLPEVVLAIGQSDRMTRLRARMRDEGAAVVQAMAGGSHVGAHGFAHTDEVVTTSEFLSGAYLTRVGLRSTPLAAFEEERSFAPEAYAGEFVTFIDPTPERGLALAVRIIEGLRDSGTPVLIIEGACREADVLRSAHRSGIDPAGWTHVRFAGPVSDREVVYQRSLMVVEPVAGHDPVGRNVLEAVLRGIPVVVSGQGALAEVGAGGAFVLGAPGVDAAGRLRLPTQREVQAWVDLIGRLTTDARYLTLARHRVRVAGLVYEAGAVRDRVASYFGGVRQQRWGEGGPIVVGIKTR